MSYARAFVIVIDGFGAGALPDAADYGDEGANTVLHALEATAGDPGAPDWPNLQALGLGNAAGDLGFDLPGCEPVEDPLASWGAMRAQSPGKDTISGHWEIAGIVLEHAFATFPPGYPSFPEPLVRAFEAEVGRRVLGNKAASGTEIIEELGEEHARTGRPIVYTSADSVFQIAAHEEVIPVDRLYEICRVARRLCDPYRVARVIARPFVGEPGSFVRTRHRHDFTMKPPEPPCTEFLRAAGVRTVGVGKIGDIFAGEGLDESFPDQGNPACLKRTLELAREVRATDQLVFVNLVDTDMLFGHRRDPAGYRSEVARVDEALGQLLALLGEGDLLVVTADHGNDPTYRGTDHTREHAPLLVHAPGTLGRDLGVREGFSDVARTLYDFFGVDPPEGARGASFWESLE
ncbi:MAG: phosphopentomutase [Promethearchaeota archaeon]